MQNEHGSCNIIMAVRTALLHGKWDLQLERELDFPASFASCRLPGNISLLQDKEIEIILIFTRMVWIKISFFREKITDVSIIKTADYRTFAFCLMIHLKWEIEVEFELF